MKKLGTNISTIFLLLISFAVVNAQRSADDYLRAAQESLKSGNIDGAINALNKAIEINKEFVAAYEMRSRTRSFKTDFQGAVEDLNKLLEFQPTKTVYYLQRGRFRMMSGDGDGALSDFDKAIANGLKTDEIYFFRGHIKQNRGDMAGATLEFDNAIAVNPDFARAYVGKSSILMRGRNLDGAIAILKTFVERYESQPKVKSANEKIVATKKGYETSSKDDESMDVQGLYGAMVLTDNVERVNQVKSIANVYTNLCNYLRLRGNFDEAVISADKAIETDPNEYWAYGLRGSIKLEKGDLNGAVDDLTKSIKTMPQDGMRYADRGIAYLLLGKDEAAQKDFDLCLKYAPFLKGSLERRIEDARKKRMSQPTL